MAEVKNSGKKREFGTGAHRDSAENKGRCDLLPLGVATEFLGSDTLRCIYSFTITLNETSLYQALDCFVNEFGYSKEQLLLDVAKHYEAGAKVYGENNWKKGIPLHVFIDSGIRHYLKCRKGDIDERHDCAFVWNLFGAIWTFQHLPEMNDITPDITVKIA